MFLFNFFSYFSDQTLVTYHTQNWMISRNFFFIFVFWFKTSLISESSELAKFNDLSDDETLSFDDILGALGKNLKNKETISNSPFFCVFEEMKLGGVGNEIRKNYLFLWKKFLVNYISSRTIGFDSCVLKH